MRVCLGDGAWRRSRQREVPNHQAGRDARAHCRILRGPPRPRGCRDRILRPVDVDRDSETWGYVTTTPKPNWQDTPVATVVRDRLSVPVAFDTDVNAAALGEHRWGAGRNLPSVCYLTVGTGIGAGLVIHGHLVRGLVHPEVGHLRIPHDGAATRSPVSAQPTATAGKAWPPGRP